MLKKSFWEIIVCFALTFLTFTNTYAAVSNNHFQKIFTDWTIAFNHQDLEKSCRLFSKDLTATYQGFPTKNYANICDGFKKIFAESNKKYHYDFKIHQTYEENNLAAVRITWYLTVYSDDKLIEKVQDEGLDILQKNKNGNWEIVNFVGFPVTDAKT